MICVMSLITIVPECCIGLISGSAKIESFRLSDRIQENTCLIMNENPHLVYKTGLIIFAFKNIF